MSDRVFALLFLCLLWVDLAAVAYLALLPFYLPLWVPFAPLAATILVPLVLLTADLLWTVVRGEADDA